MDSFPTSASNCPSCGHVFDRATNALNDGAPKPGDVTLCIECAEPLVFTDALTVRRPTKQEWEAWSPADLEKIRLIRRAILQVHGRAPAPPATHPELALPEVGDWNGPRGRTPDGTPPAPLNMGPPRSGSRADADDVSG